ncbi:hypothetical protein PLICRDRAFT_179484 [Plicaturopsis crispa FD-325 SS-3]|uniref:histone deacetylase n=1 Tax=Plicaturopsis crispa FD-325 SS-3 TaxID=944288 RepID=A0A0C9SL12_PLICR|nr:hypothetical protein PLICRDRAFT_179484 [Plicaturopsis crispa FD-325 SS-3]
MDVSRPTDSVDRLPVVYVYSKELAIASSLLPSNKARSIMVHKLSAAFGLLSSDPGSSQPKRIVTLAPARATPKDLTMYHDEGYVEAVLDPKYRFKARQQELEGSVEFGLVDDCPAFRGLAEYVELIGGASLAAANVLRQEKADIAICWDGGRLVSHHAHKAHAAGFCYVADCVLAILALKKPALAKAISTPAPRKTHVMYLDLDLHFSDGVSQTFYSPQSSSYQQVLTLSVHHAAPGFYPVNTLSAIPDPESSDFDPYTLSIPLHRGASNSTFATIWPIIERVKDTFGPDYIVVQCGVDGLSGDPHATWNWSLGGEGSLGWCLSRIVNDWSGRKLLLGGGGYHTANAARAWTYLTSIAMGRPLSLDSEIPDGIGDAFPAYAPSFTLDVPPGQMQDHNTAEYLDSVKTSYDEIVRRLEEKIAVNANGPSRKI